MAKDKSNPVVTAPKPSRQRIPKDTLNFIKHCRWCNTMLQDGEPYKVGWVIEHKGAWLSVQGHRHCVDAMYSQMEDKHNG